jgi:hypothetical protein
MALAWTGLDSAKIPVVFLAEAATFVPTVEPPTVGESPRYLARPAQFN